MIKRKAMTLSEVLVSIAVVGILAMILVPILTKTTANKEKFLYKKAVNTMQNAITAVMQDNGVVNASNFWPEMSDGGASIREQIGAKIITLDGVNKNTSAGNTTALDPDFRSNDGMMWWGLPDRWPTGADGQPAKYIDVNVDVNGEGGSNLSSADAGTYGESSKRPDRLRVRIMKDGRVIVPSYDEGGNDYDWDNNGGDWSFESEYILSRKGNN